MVNVVFINVIYVKVWSELIEKIIIVIIIKKLVLVFILIISGEVSGFFVNVCIIVFVIFK